MDKSNHIQQDNNSNIDQGEGKNIRKKKVTFDPAQNNKNTNKKNNYDSQQFNNNNHKSTQSNKENNNVKQFSRAGIQSNLIYYLRQQNKNSKISPKMHFTSPMDKMVRLQNQQKKQSPQQKPSACFQSTNRNQLFKLQSDQYSQNQQNYEPKYSEVRANPIRYTIPPHQQAQPRQKIYSPPPCIHRGNICDSEIRRLINQMKKEIVIISKLQKELQETEFKAKKQQVDDYDIGKKKKLEDGLENEKRQIKQSLQQYETDFNAHRDRYNYLVEQNLDLLEIKELNFIPEHIQSQKMVIDYDKSLPRGELFKNQTEPDITERYFMNYTQFEPKSRCFDSFKQQQNRPQLFKEGLKLDTYEQSQKQYMQLHFHQGKNACLVDFSKQDKNLGQIRTPIHKQDTSNKDVQVRVLEMTKEGNKFQDIKGYVKFDQKIDRDMPSSTQMRTIPTQMNYFNKWRSNSPVYKNQQTAYNKEDKQSNGPQYQSQQNYNQQFAQTYSGSQSGLYYKQKFPRLQVEKSPKSVKNNNLVNDTGNSSNNIQQQQQNFTNNNDGSNSSIQQQSLNNNNGQKEQQQDFVFIPQYTSLSANKNNNNNNSNSDNL